MSSLLQPCVSVYADDVIVSGGIWSMDFSMSQNLVSTALTIYNGNSTPINPSHPQRLQRHLSPTREGARTKMYVAHIHQFLKFHQHSRARGPHTAAPKSSTPAKNHHQPQLEAVRGAKCIGRESNPGLAETELQTMLVVLKAWQRLILPLNHRCCSRFSYLRTCFLDELFLKFKKYNQDK